MSLTESYNPLAFDDAPSQYPAIEKIPFIALAASLNNFCHEKFSDIVEAALARGLTSKQELRAKGWDDKKNPDPATGKNLLSFIASCDPEEATGEIQKWKHAQPRSAPSLAAFK